MELLFTGTEIEKWAAFSGDRNPIHFDPKASARLGVEKVVTHGMLALLPVKQASVDQLSIKDDCWIQFKTSIKSPILCDEKVLMSVVERRKKICFQVNSASSAVQHLVGTVSNIEPLSWQSDEKLHQLDAVEVEDKYRHFYQGFADDFDSWVWLDALIFGHFISNQIGFIFSALEKGQAQESVNCLTELTQHTVMQIGHITSMCKSLQDISFTLDSLPSIAYQIDNLSFNEDQDSAFGILELGVLLNDQHKMTIELGLMVKFNTMH